MNQKYRKYKDTKLYILKKQETVMGGDVFKRGTRFRRLNISECAYYHFQLYRRKSDGEEDLLIANKPKNLKEVFKIIPISSVRKVKKTKGIKKNG